MKRTIAILLALLALSALSGCKTATLYDQYGEVARFENGAFTNMKSREEYSIEYAIPQSITCTNTPFHRLGVPTEQVKSITVVREVESSSQGGSVLTAIGDMISGTARMAAGVF